MMASPANCCSLRCAAVANARWLAFVADFRKFDPCQKVLANSNGVPGKDRTCDPKFRKLVLYPTELRGRVGRLSDFYCARSNQKQ